MSKAYIYALICPIKNEVRYIGKSIRPMQRLKDHMNDKSNCHKSHWLQYLKSMSLMPSIQILEEVPENASWQDRERFWIKVCKTLGLPLTNNTSGGDGVCDLPHETRKRMKKIWLGRKHKPESLVLIGKASKGRTHDDEWKSNMSDLMKKRVITWGSKIAESTRKLTKEDQDSIIGRLSNGEMVKDLAQEYGVHRTTISKVKLGKYVVK